MAHAGPSSPPAVFPLIASLPLRHPSLLPLLQSHRPLAHPSCLPVKTLNAFLNRVNASVLSRDHEGDRKAASEIAIAVIKQDEEGWVLLGWGKGWLTACLGNIASAGHQSTSLQGSLALLSSLVLASDQYPSFERETVQPIMGRLAVTLGKLLERCLCDHGGTIFLLDVLETIRTLTRHTPAPFRPLTSIVRRHLQAFILRIPPPTADAVPAAELLYVVDTPHEFRIAAADLLATLHLTAGKAQSPATWGQEIRYALGGIGATMQAITGDAWEEDPPQIHPFAPPAGLPNLPADPEPRLDAALDWVQGWTEIILAYLRSATARPVPVPIAQIVSAGSRFLSLGFETPMATHISPQHHAALFSAVPRLWTSGLMLLGSVAQACGDHLFPHLTSILDHTIWVAEQLRDSLHQSQIQFFRFHHCFFALFPTALVPADYPSRLLQLCLSKLSPLLETSPPTPGRDLANGSGGKRGKKRIRDAEDGLVGGLQGREKRSMTVEEGQVILAALDLVPFLHTAPLLSPSLLTLSIRLHLSIYLGLRSMTTSSFADPDTLVSLQTAVTRVLSEVALLNESQGGTHQGWKSAIISVLDPQADTFSLLLHPSLPPLMRPIPPLNQLHFFAPEADEEKGIRQELGIQVVNDQLPDRAAGDMVVDNEPWISRRTASVPRDSHTFPPAVTTGSDVPAPHGIADATSASLHVPSALPVPDALSTVVVPGDTKSHEPLSATPESGVPPNVSVGGEPFMSAPSAVDKGKGKEVMPLPKAVPKVVEDDDEPIPELDSGSDDFDEEDEEEDGDEEE